MQIKAPLTLPGRDIPLGHAQTKHYLDPEVVIGTMNRGITEGPLTVPLISAHGLEARPSSESPVVAICGNTAQRASEGSERSPWLPVVISLFVFLVVVTSMKLTRVVTVAAMA